MRRLIRFSILLIPLLLCSASAFAAAPAHTLHVSPDLRAILTIPEEGRTLVILLILVQVAVVLASAKLLGALAERIGVPGVIGELLAGVIIGPFLLGSIIHLPLHGHWVPLFPRPQTLGQWPVNDVLWTLAQFASIVLLFITGLHTDLRQFLRYVGPAAIIAVVGVIAPFLLGVGSVYLPTFADLARSHPAEAVIIPALFVGAILAATSIGITARVLGDIEQLDSPEGVTILGAAVLDDVLGIIALAIVGGIAATGTVSIGSAAVITGKAVGVWIAITAGILLLARPIEKLLTSIPYGGAMVALALALAFLCSAVAEFFNLAFIIGAYSVGLGLSQTKVAHKLMDELRPINDFIVPIFFAVLGMLVDFRTMASDWRVLVFGLVVTVAAVVGKLIGCGVAALPVGFNSRGAYRIGLGMLPRGEVALIVAGIGLSRGIIGQNVFGVSILMTLLTTVIAPIMLVRAFRHGGSGRRVELRVGDKLPEIEGQSRILLPVPPDLAEPVVQRLIKVAEENGWAASYDQADQQIYLLRNGDDAAQVQLIDGLIRIDAGEPRRAEFAAHLAAVRQSIVTEFTAANPAASA